MMLSSVYGRLVFAPRELATKTGTRMVSARVAVDVTGRGDPETFWLDVLAFGANAELLAAHIKGEMIAATGKVTLSRYVKDGTEREQYQLVADAIMSTRTVRPSGGKRAAKPEQGVEPSRAGEFLPFDDPVPF